MSRVKLYNHMPNIFTHKCCNSINSRLLQANYQSAKTTKDHLFKEDNLPFVTTFMKLEIPSLNLKWTFNCWNMELMYVRLHSFAILSSQETFNVILIEEQQTLFAGECMLVKCRLWEPANVKVVNIMFANVCHLCVAFDAKSFLIMKPCLSSNAVASQFAWKWKSYHFLQYCSMFQHTVAFSGQ